MHESTGIIDVGHIMIKLVPTWVVVLCGLLCVVLSTNAAWADRKVALVVGNSQYKNPSLVLLNPRNDAEDVAAVLRSLDFEVVLTVDANKRDFDLAMTQFARMATGADVAFFYYAGHALQYQGRNYLMPTDGELEDEVSLRYQMVMVDDIRAAVERADGVKIIVLDACRNNPVVDDLRKKMAGISRNIEATRGLARIDKALGMVVAYSTAADDVAADGAGRNSPFTSALLRRLKEPGLEIGSMFRLIAADVNEKTHGRQRPETYVSLIGEYYLNEKDRPVWDQIKDSSDPAAFRSFIAQFPTSPRASDAQYRLRILERLAKQYDLNSAGNDAGQTRLPPAQRESANRPIPQPPPVDDNRTKLAPTEPKIAPTEPKIAASEPKRPQAAGVEAKAGTGAQKQAGLTVEPVREAPQARPAAPPALTHEQVCKRDADRLVLVRASQALDEVISLERELGCEELRPQILRLKESLGGDSVHTDPQVATPVITPITPSAPQPTPHLTVQVAGLPQPQPQVRASPAAVSDLQSPRAAVQSVSTPEDGGCKRDEEKLAHLRANPALDQIVKFEQELHCTRLRPQIARLRESVGAN
jgi:hypothetical protein